MAAATDDRRILARLTRVALFLAGLVVLTMGALWLASRPAQPDAFYEIAPSHDSVPGTLLRSEPFVRAVPDGLKGWRILYTTSRADDTRAVASAIVLVPTQAKDMPFPVIAWAHGTTGIVPGCAPSLMSNAFANVPAIDRIAKEGWAYVATDYVGLGTGGGHAYLVGDDAARNVIDAVRAARSLPGANLDTRVVVWGHSQGGNTALWTGIRSSNHASGLNVLGIAALAPAADLRALIESAQTSMFGKIASAFLLHAYSATFADIDARNYAHWRARALVSDISSRCVGGWETLFSVFETLLLPNDGIFSQDPASGPLGARLLENTPQARIAMPVLIVQGDADDLVLPGVQQRYVAARCAAGQRIDYRVYPGLDHLSLVAAESPLSTDLIQWSRERFSGRPDFNSCLP